MINPVPPEMWKPFLERIDVILEGKKQPKLTQNESQNIVNNWHSACMQHGEIIVQVPFPFSTALLKRLERMCADIVYDVLKASRGEAYK